MQDRREAVLLLAGELLDYLPQARQSSSLLETTPGLSASREVPCGVCKGRGRMTGQHPCVSCPPRLGPQVPPPAFKTRHGCVPCLGCDGTGWRRRRVGDPEFDAYSGTEIGSEQGDADRKRWEELQDLERRLAHTERLLALHERPDTVEEAWEESRARMWRQGDYARLVRAMEGLRAIYPRRFSIFWRVCVLHEDVRLSESLREELDRTAALIAAAMGPKRIRVPRHLEADAANEARKQAMWRGQTPAHAKARRERDELIRAMRSGAHDGTPWKFARLARHFALSERQIKTIVKGAE